MVPLEFLGAIRRSDVVAYARGKMGFWTRVVAARLGCPLVFASLEGDEVDQSVPSLSQLIDDYGPVRPTSASTEFGNILHDEGISACALFKAFIL